MKKTLKLSELDDFVKCYSVADRSKRKEDKAAPLKRSQSMTAEGLLKRDNLLLDINWPKAKGR
jgi:hypothetical protein